MEEKLQQVASYSAYSSYRSVLFLFGARGRSAEAHTSNLPSQGAQDVLVVVNRWYGGVQLGNDRFKLINSVSWVVFQSSA